MKLRIGVSRVAARRVNCELCDVTDPCEPTRADKVKQTHAGIDVNERRCD